MGYTVGTKPSFPVRNRCQVSAFVRFINKDPKRQRKRTPSPIVCFETGYLFGRGDWLGAYVLPFRSGTPDGLRRQLSRAVDRISGQLELDDGDTPEE